MYILHVQVPYIEMLSSYRPLRPYSRLQCSTFFECSVWLACRARKQRHSAISPTLPPTGFSVKIVPVGYLYSNPVAFVFVDRAARTECLKMTSSTRKQKRDPQMQKNECTNADCTHKVKHIYFQIPKYI